MTPNERTELLDGIKETLSDVAGAYYYYDEEDEAARLLDWLVPRILAAERSAERSKIAERMRGSYGDWTGRELADSLERPGEWP